MRLQYALQLGINASLNQDDDLQAITKCSLTDTFKRCRKTHKRKWEHVSLFLCNCLNYNIAPSDFR